VEGLDEIVLRALWQEPPWRFQEAREVKTDVENIRYCFYVDHFHY
jgi:hypothetical protein